jgi:hypothetical protein
LLPPAYDDSSPDFAPNWAWELPVNPVQDGNWGLTVSRVPQMWNFNDAIKRSRAVLPPSDNPRVLTGIIDGGFCFAHPDVPNQILARPTVIDLADTDFLHLSHGLAVAGIIGGSFTNRVGIEGVDPFARMAVRGAASPVITTWDGLTSRAWIFDQLRALAVFHARVINVSLGINAIPGHIALEYQQFVYDREGLEVKDLMDDLNFNYGQLPLVVVIRVIRCASPTPVRDTLWIILCWQRHTWQLSRAQTTRFTRGVFLSPAPTEPSPRQAQISQSPGVHPHSTLMLPELRSPRRMSPALLLIC